MTVFAVSSVLFGFLIQLFAGQYGLDWIWISAQVRAESSFDPRAESPVGAKGLMQIMDSTADWLAGISGELLYDPKLNLRIGTYYMQYLKRWWLKRGVKDYRFALASYNCGAGRVYRVWKKRKGTYESIERELPVETIHYVRRIVRWANLWNSAANFIDGLDQSLGRVR